MPIMGLLIDDCQGTKLFSSSAFQNLCLRHRHVSDGLGVTILMACQTYSGRTGGLPNTIRVSFHPPYIKMFALAPAPPPGTGLGPWQLTHVLALDMLFTCALTPTAHVVSFYPVG